MMRAALLDSLAATAATKAPPSCPAAKGTPTVRRGGLVMRPSSYSAAGLQGSTTRQAAVSTRSRLAHGGPRNSSPGLPTLQSEWHLANPRS